MSLGKSWEETASAISTQLLPKLSRVLVGCTVGLPKLLTVCFFLGQVWVQCLTLEGRDRS